jgi:hypothetical protein
MGLVAPVLRGLSENLYIMYEPYIVDNSAYTQAFGDHATPLRAAVDETIAWYCAHTTTNAHVPIGSVASQEA